MDLQPVLHPEASSSSTPSNVSNLTLQHQPQASSLASSSFTEFRAIRSSARVKAAKQKETQKGGGKGKESESINQSSTSASYPENLTTRITRSTSNNKLRRDQDTSRTSGKTKATLDASPRASKRARRSDLQDAPSLTIKEPPRDVKGKKRAAPEYSEEEDTAAQSTSTTKQTRNTSYSLRSRVDKKPRHSIEMPRKPRNSPTKGKIPMKTKGITLAGSSQADNENLDMDAEYTHEVSDQEEHVEERAEEGAVVEDSVTNDDTTHDSGGCESSAGADETGVAVDAELPIAPSTEESPSLAIFGDYRQFGSYMMSLSSRLKTMLTNIKITADSTTRLLTLQELSELLSISTEDTLAGSFQVEQFVRELVKILGGRGIDEDEEDDADDDQHEQDEDNVLAAALALSTGGAAYQGDENLEAQVLACRCLANLMEALPGVAHTVVYHGAIPVLCNKLVEISYIDLAEQTLSTLEKISEEFPSSIVREGGLAALLNYLDFFSIAVQRTALQAAANCCRNISPDHYPMIRHVWPIIRNCLSYSDQRLVEYACMCVIRVIDSYHRASIQNLESLVDSDMIRAINMLLLPTGGSPLVATNTYTLLLRSLATAVRASPKIAIALLEADIVDTLYQILTGALPPSSYATNKENGSVTGHGLGGGLVDVTIMENLAHRAKDQVEEVLSLISELMPPLPKDGVFDHKGYTEKSLSRMVKGKAKADRLSARQAAAGNAAASNTSIRQPSPASQEIPPVESGSMEPQTQDAEDVLSNDPVKDRVADRTGLLRTKSVVVGRFMHLIVPILVDVYAASVITPVRVKTLTGLLKAVSFLGADSLKHVLESVPIASFASSILSSKDHATLIIGALQLVDMLLTKVPILYKPTFRREGVFHEVEALAAREVLSTRNKEKEKDKSSPDTPPLAETSVVATGPPNSTSTATIPGYKKLSSLSLEPDDAITLRARVIRFKHLTGAPDEDNELVLAALRNLVTQLTLPDASEILLSNTLKELAQLFASPHASVSSFELLQSGVVDAILQFLTDDAWVVNTQNRKEMFLVAFNAQNEQSNTALQTPFAILVKKLQESLTRMEPFDVVTVAHGSDENKRSSPSLLARQLRLRLVADDDSDIPRTLHNIVVSIHAIATFQALHDYMRPRVAGLLNSGTRLSGMLAALAASGISSGASLRAFVEHNVKESSPTRINATMEGNIASSPTNASAEPPIVGRRRSQRLSVKNVPATSTGLDRDQDDLNDTGPDEVTTVAISSPDAPFTSIATSIAEAAPSDTVVDSEMAADFTDDEIDAEVFEDDVDQETSFSEKTVMLSIAEDGHKVVAQTPDGTRVATPNCSKEVASTSSPQQALSTRVSYASALKAKPTDWHIGFSMDDHFLPLDLTIYGAIHQHEMRKASGALPPTMIWQGVHTVKFKKVAGPLPLPDGRADGVEAGSKNRSPPPTLSALPEDAAHSKILRLLRVLHKLNAIDSERSTNRGGSVLPESAFVNNKVTAKLTRQLEEPMIVASSCLPDWALDLPQHFPFIFPFATRYNFLQSTSFGYARLILKWQSQQPRTQDTSRRDDGIGFLGRLQRQKVRISRKHILESAVKVFEMYGSSSSILEVEYFEEVGTGLGPTLEFYSLVSKEFARRDLKIWRDADATFPGLYVHHPSGLYPAPILPEDIVNDGGQKRTHIFRVIGQFLAKAMLDSRIIDLSLNKVFVRLILGEEVPRTIATLKLVDIELANSLTKLQALSKAAVKTVSTIEPMKVEDLELDFTLPGYDIELRPGGRDMVVTAQNVDSYIQDVLDALIGKGAQLQAKALRDGFSRVFPITDLQAFSAEEMVMLFGNADEDWSAETLNEALKADHGFNIESRPIRYLIEIMSEFDAPTRRDYLQFITGSPKLPIGGFRGLNPPLTVVRKPHEAPLAADDYLPSVMTCVNYLKLPEYSSKVVMRERLRTAIYEGEGSFHLS